MSAVHHSTSQKLLAEFLGTAMLLCAVIGSGIMAERLAGGNMAIALLANTLATVFALFVLIEIFGPMSGAHFNPLVTLWDFFYKKDRPPPDVTYASSAHLLTVLGYITAQLTGAICGAWLTHAMFDVTILQTSSKLRGGWEAGWGQWIAEAVATAGLIVVIARSGGQQQKAKASEELTRVPTSALVACYIGAAYWCAASTSFANPAAVLGRMFSDSFAGIAPASAFGFVLAQCLGALAGAGLVKALEANLQGN